MQGCLKLHQRSNKIFEGEAWKQIRNGEARLGSHHRCIHALLGMVEKNNKKHISLASGDFGRHFWLTQYLQNNATKKTVFAFFFVDGIGMVRCCLTDFVLRLISLMMLRALTTFGGCQHAVAVASAMQALVQALGIRQIYLYIYIHIQSIIIWLIDIS